MNRARVGSLPHVAESVFVGREQEMAVLRAGLDDALSGQGHVLLLVGEPGIGKTRVVSELAAEARLQGARVFWGRCYEGEGAPPFWPWVQILRTYMENCDLDLLRTEMGLGAANIAQAIPEVRERLPELSLPPQLGLEQARFHFFDSVTRLLKTVAQREPLVLILDDLHWADTPSLLLLQFIAQELSDARLLVIGTYRDIELKHQHSLAQTLGEIVRVPGSQSITLQGFGEREVVRFIESAGLQAPESLVSAIYKETEGNPFFLTEIVRLFVTESHQSAMRNLQSPIEIPIPQGVRMAIGRRLQGLSAECQQVLSLAAVIGREFELDTLEAVGKEFSRIPTGDRLLEILEEADAARIIHTVPQTVSRYSFSHVLIRETLYEEMSPARRVRLHRQIAEVLEPLYASKPESHPVARSGRVLAELAYHFSQAALGSGDTAKSIIYAMQAGEQAMAALAYEDAVIHYGRARESLKLGEADEAQHCELLLALGAARRRANDIAGARETFQQAVTLARQLGAQKSMPQAASFLARATLGFGGESWFEHGTADEPLVALLEEALGALDAGERMLRARLLARLAVALFYFANAQERRAALSQQALELARQVGDTATLAYALNSRHWALWGDANVQERLAIATETVRLAEQVNARELALIGRAWRIADLLQLGDLTAVDEEGAVFARLAAGFRQPLYQWWTLMFQTMRALLAGRFVETEQLAQQALAMGQRVHPQTAARIFGTLLSFVFRQQGRLAELEALLTLPVAQHRQGVAFPQVGRALLYSDLGREAEARQELAALAAQGFVNLPGHGETALVSISVLAQVCAILADTRHAATLYEILLPYAGLTIVGGGIGAIVCVGAASRYLGLLAATLSRWEEAEQHFTDALKMNTRMGARPYVAYTQHEYARMLLTRNQSSDREQAQKLLEAALATAQELEMKGLEDKIQGLGARDWRLGEEGKTSGETMPVLREPSIPNPQHPIPNTPHPVSNLFRREGAYWTIAYQGTLCRLKEAKGLHYLAALLRDAGREFHVIDLAALTSSGPTLSTTSSKKLNAKVSAAPHTHISRLGDTGGRLDAQAKAAYKRRLEDLQDQLEEAERFNDPDRAAKARAEIDFLSNELAAAYGLRGHAHKSSDNNKRVRQAVSYCIRDSLNKIRTVHPTLWRHLLTSIKTGTFCSYNPEQPVSWEV